MTDYYVFQSPIGMLKICEENGRLTRLSAQREGLDVPSPQNYVRHSDFLYEVYRQINEYFAGKRITFNIPMACIGTPFQRQVWRELQSIPYGETRSYEEIAIGIGQPKAVRAVGQANHRNPIMIVVPCHRVIRKNGAIGGFGCGAEIKKYLLDMEQRNPPPENK